MLQHNPSHSMQGTKAVMKDIAKYLPGIGWSFLFMEYPLLKRDWGKDKDRLTAACKNLADYPVNMLVGIRTLVVLRLISFSLILDLCVKKFCTCPQHAMCNFIG